MFSDKFGTTMQRRAALAAIATTALGGCLATSSSGGDGGDGAGGDDGGNQEGGGLQEDVREEIVDEERLLEAEVVSILRFDEFQAVDEESGDLETIEPERDQFAQASIVLRSLGEEDEEPAVDVAAEDVAIASVETGDRFEPVEWPLQGVAFDALREEDVVEIEQVNWSSLGTARLRPVFDVPSGGLVADVARIFDRDEPVLLRGPGSSE